MKSKRDGYKKYSILVLLVFAFLITGYRFNSSKPKKSETRRNSGINFKHQQDYLFTMWVETNTPPTTDYYDQLAITLVSTPNLGFSKVLVRVNGAGAASGETWYDSMNPMGNNNNPIILEILRKLQGTNIEVYAIPYIASGDFWDIYSGNFDAVDDAPSLSAWMAANGGIGAYKGSLKQSIHWIKDINNIAQTKGITKTITGILYEPEGSPYPPVSGSANASAATLQAIQTYMKAYGLTNIKVGVTAAGPNDGPTFVQYSKAGILDEGYIEMYNLTVNPAIDPSHNYVDALSATAKITNPIPARPNTIYTDAWLNNPSTAGQTVWQTNPATWQVGQNMGFQHSHDTSKNIGLLNYSFYNGGSGYYYYLGCTPGSAGCPKIYFMFSTECGPNPPSGITCDCVVAGCPQSKISAFGTWSTGEGLDQFLQFIDAANVDWQLPIDQFAVFQYQLLPKSWLSQ